LSFWRFLIDIRVLDQVWSVAALPRIVIDENSFPPRMLAFSFGDTVMEQLLQLRMLPSYAGRL